MKGACAGGKFKISPSKRLFSVMHAHTQESTFTNEKEQSINTQINCYLSQTCKADDTDVLVFWKDVLYLPCLRWLRNIWLRNIWLCLHLPLPLKGFPALLEKSLTTPVHTAAPGEYKRPARWPQVSVDWASVGSFYTVLPPASEAESADTTAMARHAGESALVALLVLAAAMALPGQAYHLLSSDGSDSSVIEPRHLQRALACGGITASPGSETVLGPGQTVCVASPRYPNNYPKNWDNNWTIKGATPNVRLEISCSPVAIEGSPSCTNDRLVIMHKCFWSKYCGKKRPETITTCGPWARLTFRTNGSAQQKGFYCTVTASERTCSSSALPGSALGPA
ncbi:uncharacterized protein LOC119591208 [Penaeus monodon]|uniref:uncharacterized protein LOC119591208 n=1 Tax=Penaeus monodon TaxID=6687 RepID=UPI0018A72FAE|nr:uncharacterized protein LOC119591208 [Penaeus monodon]